jgi:hypothetical protein
MANILTMDKADIQTQAQGMIDAMLANPTPPAKPTTLNDLYNQIGMLDGPLGGLAKGKKDIIDQAAQQNNINFNGKYKELAQTQFNTLITSVSTALYAAKEEVKKTNPTLAGEALAQKISEGAQAKLEQNQSFKNALGFANGIRKAADDFDPKTPPVTITQVMGYAKDWLSQNVPTKTEGQTVTSANQATPENTGKPAPKGRVIETTSAPAPAAKTEVKPAAPTTPAPTTQQVINPAPTTFDTNNPEGIVAHINKTNPKLLATPQMQSAYQAWLEKAVRGEAGAGNIESTDIFSNLGKMWNKTGQPVWEGFFRIVMGLGLGLFELIGGKGWDGAVKKFQDYTASSATGSQMDKVLTSLRDVMPEDIAYKDASGADAATYKIIRDTRQAELTALENVKKAQSDRTGKLLEPAQTAYAAAKKNMEALDAENLRKYGKNSEDLWRSFVAYKTELMDTTASAMGSAARQNGLVDTPTDGKLLVDAWAGNRDGKSGSYAVADLVKPKDKLAVADANNVQSQGGLPAGSQASNQGKSRAASGT